MAIENSPRLGIERWSHGTDRHPPRAVWDAQQAILDDLVAIDRQYATLAERPTAGVRGAYCWVEETGILYRDDGSQWRPVVQFGGGAGATVVAGGSGSEGSSSRAARADHSHPLPLATSSVDGAMRKADKALLDAATANATANALVRRDANGRASVSSLGLSGDPAAAGDAARKAYVDAQAGAVHNATSLPAAANLDAYTSPGVWAQPQHTGAANGTNYPVPRAGLLLVHTAGDFVFQRYVVTRLESGGHQDVDYKRTRYSGTWGPWREQASTDYVDAGDTAARSYADSAVAAIPEATRTRAGLMPAADKALVDDATVTDAANTLVKRNGASQFSVGTPTSTSHVARKDYVDAGDATRLPYGQSAGTGSIDSLLTPGHYHQASSAPVTTANGYPINGSAGALSVLPFGTSANWVIQTFTEWTTRRTFTRATNAGATGWTAWTEWANTDTATPSADGLMSRSDKALLDTATSGQTSGALVRRDGAGRSAFSSVQVLSTSNSNDAARKDYVDAGDAAAQSNAEATAAAALSPVKALTDAATANATANTLVRRDSAGRFKSATPSATTDVANKSYVDSALSPVKALTDAATPNATASTIVRRDASNRFRSGTPSASTDVANKSYVDGRASSAQSSAESTAAAALAPVKATVDGATSGATANTLMQRDSSGRVSVGTPSSASHAATKGYVDGRDNTIQTALDPLTYNSGVREKVFTGTNGEKCTVKLARIGPVVMVTIDDFRHTDLVTMFLSGEIPVGFRPVTRSIAVSAEGSVIHIETSGTALIRARGPESTDVYARRASTSYLTTDAPPSSFTWGDPA